MDPKLLTALVGAAAAVLGAIAGGLAKGYVSRQKFRELEFEYEKRLQSGYLENARAYLSSVYVPLAILVTRLNSSFQSYRSDPTSKQASDQFIASIQELASGLIDLGEKGGNAFLTTDLDETLQSFNEFLFGSRCAHEVSMKLIVKFELRSIPFVSYFGTEREYTLSGKRVRQFGSGSIDISLGGLGIAYQATEILKAPLSSSEFEERFVRDIHTINILIKEVTLGSKARENT